MLTVSPTCECGEQTYEAFGEKEGFSGDFEDEEVLKRIIESFDIECFYNNIPYLESTRDWVFTVLRVSVYLEKTLQACENMSEKEYADFFEIMLAPEHDLLPYEKYIGNLETYLANHPESKLQKPIAEVLEMYKEALEP